MSVSNAQFREALIPLVIGHADETKDSDDPDWWVEPKYDRYAYPSFEDDAAKGMGVRTEYGWITHVESGVYLDSGNEKIEFSVFKINDQYFKVEGYSDSWSGEGETYWDQAYEVTQRPVTRYEYLRVPETDETHD